MTYVDNFYSIFSVSAIIFAALAISQSILVQKYVGYRITNMKRFSYISILSPIWILILFIVFFELIPIVNSSKIWFLVCFAIYSFIMMYELALVMQPILNKVEFNLKISAHLENVIPKMKIDKLNSLISEVLKLDYAIEDYNLSIKILSLLVINSHADSNNKELLSERYYDLIKDPRRIFKLSIEDEALKKYWIKRILISFNDLEDEYKPSMIDLIFAKSLEIGTSITECFDVSVLVLLIEKYSRYLGFDKLMAKLLLLPDNHMSLAKVIIKYIDMYSENSNYKDHNKKYYAQIEKLFNKKIILRDDLEKIGYPKSLILAFQEILIEIGGKFI